MTPRFLATVAPPGRLVADARERLESRADRRRPAHGDQARLISLGLDWKVRA